MAALAWTLGGTGRRQPAVNRRFGTIANYIGLSFSLLLAAVLLLILWQSDRIIAQTITHQAQLSLKSTLHRIGGRIHEKVTDSRDTLRRIAASPLLPQRLHQLNQHSVEGIRILSESDPIHLLLTTNHQHALLLIDLQQRVRLLAHGEQNIELSDILDVAQLQRLRTAPLALLQTISLPPSQDRDDHHGIIWYA
ncbi:MAG: hypothetical protein R8J84_02000, partial [Mariprofundales bacterium]